MRCGIVLRFNSFILHEGSEKLKASCNTEKSLDHALRFFSFIHKFRVIIGPAILGMLVFHFLMRPVVERAFDVPFDDAFYDPDPAVYDRVARTGSIFPVNRWSPGRDQDQDKRMAVACAIFCSYARRNSPGFHGSAGSPANRHEP